MVASARTAGWIASAAMLTGGAVVAGCGGGSDEKASGGSAKASVSDIANYAKPDREQYLYTCAKKEGQVVMYTSSSTVDPFAKEAFEKQYPGVTLKPYVDTAGTLVPKIVQEERAGQHKFDVYGQILGSLERDDKYFTKFTTPSYDKVKPDLRSPYFVAYEGVFSGFAYNPKLLSYDQVPHTWQDMLKPQYKGKIYQAMDTSVVLTMAMLRQKLGDDFIKRYADQVRVQRSGGRQVADQLEAGTIPMGSVISHGYYKRDYLDKGAQFRWLPMDPMIGLYQAASISKNAPHPCGAALLLDWLIAPDGGKKVFVDQLGGASEYAEGPQVPFDIENAPPQASWNVTFNTDPSLSKGFPSYQDALKAWTDDYEKTFLAG